MHYKEFGDLQNRAQESRDYGSYDRLVKHSTVLGFSCGSDGKESAWNAWDLGLIPGLGRSPGEGEGYPLLYSGLENSMDPVVHGVAKSWTRLSDLHFQFQLLY